MTPDRLRECLDLIGWSQRGLADKLEVDERQARRWAAGAAPIPDLVADWLERVGAFHAANPAPAGRVRASRTPANPLT